MDGEGLFRLREYQERLDLSADMHHTLKVSGLTNSVPDSYTFDRHCPLLRESTLHRLSMHRRQSELIVSP
jgi:hypothetical protein